MIQTVPTLWQPGSVMRWSPPLTGVLLKIEVETKWFMCTQVRNYDWLQVSPSEPRVSDRFDSSDAVPWVQYSADLCGNRIITMSINQTPLHLTVRFLNK